MGKKTKKHNYEAIVTISGKFKLDKYVEALEIWMNSGMKNTLVIIKFDDVDFTLFIPGKADINIFDKPKRSKRAPKVKGP